MELLIILSVLVLFGYLFMPEDGDGNGKTL